MLVVLLAAAQAAAAKRQAGGAKRLAVLRPEGIGKKEASITGKIGAVLKQHKVQVAPLGPLKKALRKGGLPSSEADWVKLAYRLKVDGFVESTISHDGGTREIEIRIRNGADGSIAGKESFAAKGPAKKLAAVIGASFWKKLGSAVRQTSVPKKEEGGGLPARDLPAAAGEPALAESKTESKTERTTERTTERKIDRKTDEATPSGGLSSGKPAVEAEVEPEEKPRRSAARDHEEEEEEATASRPAQAAPGSLPAFEVEADLRALRRVFAYVPESAARNYVLNFYTPVVAARVAWFPIKYLGVFGGAETSLALETGQYPTATREFQAGIQFRMPFSFGQVGATAGYLQHYFLIRDTPDPNDASRLELQVPNTVYVGGRFGASARFKIGSRMQAGVEVAYRLVTNPGRDIGQVRSEQFFPNAAAPVGVDAGAFFGYRVSAMVEIRGGVDYRRYAFGRLLSGPDAFTAIDATGALDQYVALFLGAAGTFGAR